jgi:hypothetical protein
MLVCRQGAANSGLYRKAVNASHFLSCPIRSLLDAISHSLKSLIYKNVNHSLYIFLTIHIFVHYFLLVTWSPGD